MLDANGIGMRFGSRWLWRGLDLRPRAGMVTGLLGPNGVGKTTLLRCLAGLQAPSEGTVSRPAAIGYVPQRSEITLPYSAREVVAMGRAGHAGLFRGLNRQDNRKIAWALERTGATAMANARFTTMSGGERQLVLIARALATGAQLLILDEPLSPLDIRHQSMVLKLLMRLSHEDGLCIIFSAHDPDHLLAGADSTVILSPDTTPCQGPTRHVLTEARLTALYNTPIGLSQTAHGLHVLPAYLD